MPVDPTREGWKPGTPFDLAVTEIEYIAVDKCKRYEDASLSYTEISKHEGEGIGLYDTVLSRVDYRASFVNKAAEAYDSAR